MKVFRLRIIDHFGECALAAPVNFTYRIANLFPSQAVQCPRHQACFHVFQLWYRFLLPPGECRGKTFAAFAGWQKERSEEHTSELQSLRQLVCRLLLEKKKNNLTP